MPHELEVLAATYEDIAIIAGDKPIVQLPGPLVTDFSDAEYVAWVVDSLNAWAGHVCIMVEKVDLTGDNDCGFIFV